MLVTDIETTGLDPVKAAILSIGAVNLLKPNSRFYTEIRVPTHHNRGLYVGPVEISDEALEINGENRDSIHSEQRVPLCDALTSFEAWAQDAENITLAGENVGSFDCVFLQCGYSRLDMRWPFGHRSIDMHTIAASILLSLNRHSLPLKDRRSKLDSTAIFALVGLPEEPKPHNALKGAEWEAEAIYRLLYGTGLLPEFAHLPVRSLY